MRKIITGILFFVTICLQSQVLIPEEVNTGGDYTENEKYTLSSTIGGLVSSTLENEFVLTQGFQQPFNLFMDEPLYFVENLLKLKAFPNPSTDVVYFSIESEIEPIICFIRILDTKGNAIDAPAQYYEFIKGQNISLNLSKITIGPYIIQFISKEDNQVIAQVKIVKI